MLHSQLLSAVVVQVVESCRPLPADLAADIEALWMAEQRQRGGALFDGQIFSVSEMALPRIAGSFVPYRWWMAQRRRPDLYPDLRIRPLAVSGLLRCADGIVFGRRGRHTTDHARQWELVPSGGIDPGCVDGTHVIPERQLLRELEEEIGMAGPADISACQVFCVLEDAISRVIDLGFILSSPCTGEEVLTRHRSQGSDEYSALAVVEDEDLNGRLAAWGDDLIAASAEMVRLWRLAQESAVRQTEVDPRNRTGR